MLQSARQKRVIRGLSELDRLLLTVVLEFGGILMSVKVAIGIDDGMFLLEVVRAFLADSVGLMGEGSDASISRLWMRVAHETHEPMSGHAGLSNKIK